MYRFAASHLELNQYLDGVLAMRSWHNSADLKIRTLETCTGITEDIINVWTARVLLIRIISLLLPVEVDQLKLGKRGQSQKQSWSEEDA
jgi:hypothetical protein